MPFTQEVIHFKEISIHLMRFNAFDPMDYLEQLTDTEKERFFTFSHLNRKCEFVATRILRHRIFGFQHIHYDDHGAPYIEGEGYISISHAPGVVGLALSKDFKIGLDLEPIRGKAQKLHTKFVSDKEHLLFDVHSEIEMTKVWSAKEALYKIAGRKQIIFKNDLHLSKITNDIWQGVIINPTESLSLELKLIELENLIVAVTCTKPLPL